MRGPNRTDQQPVRAWWRGLLGAASRAEARAIAVVDRATKARDEGEKPFKWLRVSVLCVGMCATCGLTLFAGGLVQRTGVLYEDVEPQRLDKATQARCARATAEAAHHTTVSGWAVDVLPLTAWLTTRP